MNYLSFCAIQFCFIFVFENEQKFYENEGKSTQNIATNNFGDAENLQNKWTKKT